MSEPEYRDTAPLSDIIREAYIDGLSDGESWSCRVRHTDNRDYAAARADRLEAEVERLRGLLHDVAESGVVPTDERIRWIEVQIDRETWAQIVALVRTQTREETQ